MKKYSRPDPSLKYGWRSGLEEKVGQQLRDAGVPFEYETLRIFYLPSPKPRSYTPDYILPNGIIVESKGRFVTQDRQKHLLIKQQHPDLDIRLLFSNARARISKQSKTTYALWAEQKGFLYADKGIIPSAWINEPPNRASLAAIEAMRK
jgi:Autographiviridae endonuclease I